MTDALRLGSAEQSRRWPTLVVILAAVLLAAITTAGVITYIGSRPPEPPPGTNGILYRHNPHGGRAPGGYPVDINDTMRPGSLGLGSSTIGPESIKHDALTADFYLKQISIPGPGESVPEILSLRTLHLVDVSVGDTFVDGTVTIRVLQIWRSSTTDDLRVYLHVTYGHG